MSMKQLEQLAKLAKDQVSAEEVVAQKEEELKRAKAVLDRIAGELIPELMEQYDLETFTTTDGLKINVAEKIRANISPPNREAVFKWLRMQGKDGIIKHKIVVDFGKGNEEDSQKLAEILLSKGWKYKDDKSIHAQTLSAFVREQLGEGVELPEQITVYRQRISRIG